MKKLVPTRVVLACILVLIMVSGCGVPDYITSHGTHIYYSCDDPNHDFPTNYEVDLMLDHFIEHGEKCLPMAASDAYAVLSYMTITLACHGPSGRHYDRYFRDDIFVDWRGCGRIWTVYHEIMHPMYRYYRGGTDHDHLDQDWQSGATCLIELFELAHGWVI